MNESEKIRHSFEKQLKKKTDNLFDDVFNLNQFFFEKKSSKKLYRYRAFDEKEKNINSFFEGKMYFSNPLNFNDPHDCLMYLNENIISNNVDIPLHYKIDNAGDLIKKTVSMACLSESFDSTLMWSHYADSHKGYVLEYDLSSLRYNHKINIVPIIYSKERYDGTEQVIRMCREAFERESNTRLHYDLICPFIYKAKEWEYEKEWRLIRNRTNKKEIFHLDIEPTAIFLGEKISINNRKKILSISKDKNLPTYEMYIDYSIKEFKLNHRDIKL